MTVGDWTTGFNATPDGATELGSVLDDKIQELKTLIRERASIELNWGTASFEAGYGDTGRANPGSARAFVQTGTPTGLRRPDNSANQTGTSLTKAADQGRLWADTNDNNRLYVIDPDAAGAGATFNPVAAIPTHTDIVTGTSTSTAAIASGGVTDLTFSDASLLTPAEGIWRIWVMAQVHIKNGSAANRTIRLDIHQTAPGAVFADAYEWVLKSDEEKTAILLHTAVLASASTTYTYKVVGEASGATCTYNGASCTLTGNGAATRTHRLWMWMAPYPT